MKIVNLANHRPKESTLEVLKRYDIDNLHLIVDPATQFRLVYDFARRIVTSAAEPDEERTAAIDVCRLLNLLTSLHDGLVFPFGTSPTIAVRKSKEDGLLSVYVPYIDFAESQRILAEGLPYTDAEQFLTVSAEYIDSAFAEQADDPKLHDAEPHLKKLVVDHHTTQVPLSLYRRLLKLREENHGKMMQLGRIFVVTLPISSARCIRICLQSPMFDL